MSKEDDAARAIRLLAQGGEDQVERNSQEVPEASGNGGGPQGEQSGAGSADDQGGGEERGGEVSKEELLKELAKVQDHVDELEEALGAQDEVTKDLKRKLFDAAEAVNEERSRRSELKGELKVLDSEILGYVRAAASVPDRAARMFLTGMRINGTFDEAYRWVHPAGRPWSKICVALAWLGFLAIALIEAPDLTTLGPVAVFVVAAGVLLIVTVLVLRQPSAAPSAYGIAGARY